MRGALLSFIDKSNKQARGEMDWCRTHPTAVWGKNPATGKFFLRCSTGHKLYMRGLNPNPCVRGGEKNGQQ